MLPIYLPSRYRAYIRRCLSLIATMFYVLPAYSQVSGTNLSNIASNLSAQSMLVNIAQQLPALTRMVTAIAYVTGLYFVVWGIFKLKQYGESRTMMSGQHHLKEPMVFLIVGALLLYLPSSVQVGMSTFWTNPNPYGYIPQTDQWSQFINICFMIVQFVGIVAFIRGLVILSHLGGHHGGQGTLAKGMMHIIGGLFCINIYQFVQTIFGTVLGIQIL